MEAGQLSYPPLEITPARVHSIKHHMLKRMRNMMMRLEQELGEV